MDAFHKNYTHRASGISYTPYGNGSTSLGWVSAPTAHSTLATNASLQVRWTGRGVQVYGTVQDTQNITNGTFLLSLDGGPFREIFPTNSGNNASLLNYSTLPYGEHAIVMSNPAGGNMSITGLSLGYAKGESGSIGMSRTIPATIMDSSGNWTQNPDLNWSGNWAPDVNGPASPPGMVSHPNSLSSVWLNVSETSAVYIYGLPTSLYSISIHWRSSKGGLTKRSSFVKRASDYPPHKAKYEKLAWKGNLDRTRTYYIDVDVIANGGEWGLSRVVVADGLASSNLVRTVVIAVVVPVGVLLLLALCWWWRRRARRAPRQSPDEYIYEAVTPNGNPSQQELSSSTSKTGTLFGIKKLLG